MDEVLLHNEASDAWTVINGVVFNLTPYMNFHPGGTEQLLRCAGRDGTELFNEVHKWVNIAMIQNCVVGRALPVKATESMGPPGAVVGQIPAPGGGGGGGGGGSPSVEQIVATLAKKTQLTHDTFLFEFSLPDKVELRALLGQHVMMRVKLASGRMAARPYTIVGEDPLVLSVAIKVYSDGVFTSHLGSLELGAQVSYSNPSGDFPRFLQARLRGLTKVTMVGAGTGVTPYLRLLRYFLTNQDAKTPAKSKITFTLVTVNRTEQDILFREEFESLGSQCPDRLTIHHSLTRPADGWAGQVGRFEDDMAARLIPEKPERGEIALVCGPVLMVKATVRVLARRGFSAQQIHEFV
jgi:NAD(P)H-flavin reductase